MGSIFLITGGARSGKSDYALHACRSLDARRKYFIATAEACDAEMRKRIIVHQNQRKGEFFTIEAPYELATSISQLPAKSVAIIDCLTVWLGNTFYAYGNDIDKVRRAVTDLVQEFDSVKHRVGVTLYVVTNEVGWGLVPADRMSRDFRDEAGRLNREVASCADGVYLCVSGIPVCIKAEEQ